MATNFQTEIADLLTIQEYENSLLNVNESDSNYRFEYYKMQAKLVGADYIYCIKSELENQLIPFIYIYDKRNSLPDNIWLADINKKIWTVGEIPVAVVIYTDEIKIIDSRKPIKKEDEANIYITVANISEKLKSKIFQGRFLEESDTDYISLSPYETLLQHIETNILKKQNEIGCDTLLLKGLIVKFILIKYLEEQTDINGESVFQKGFFDQFLDNKPQKDANFCEVLREGDIVALLEYLDIKFNGGIFKLNPSEKSIVSGANLFLVANALDGNIKPMDGQITIWRLYDFNLLPIEFISRLYERFVVSGNNQKQYGAYYTPPHLARLLVDEVLPLDKQIDFSDFKILDPSCGSGIFLVLAYKRLITLWMLKHNKQTIKGENDIKAIQKILSQCIFGVDINPDALAITATSLQIELTSHIQPKDIWENLQFQDIQTCGNLIETGFFKWYKTQQQDFNIIIGNPPFNIGDEINKRNVAEGKDDDFEEEKYYDFKNKLHSFPYKNSALTFFYKCLENLLSPSGHLFMVMPASSFLYIPTSENFRQTIYYKWNVSKIYDFTPLINHLWGKTKVATIAIKVGVENLKENIIEHIIVRNTTLNEKGSTLFQVDKYDKFFIPNNPSFISKYQWKLNLFGGGKLIFHINRYKNEFVTVKEFIKLNNWNFSTGLRNDKSSDKQINLEGKKVLISDNFVRDLIDDKCIDVVIKPVFRREISHNIAEPPNILIRLNLNYSIPIVYNTESILFFPGVLGIKGKNMYPFFKVFKENRSLYKTLIKVSSSNLNYS